MSTMPVLDANGNQQQVQLPNGNGRAAASDSRPVVLSNEDLAALGVVQGVDAAGATAAAKPIGIGGIARGSAVLGVPTFSPGQRSGISTTIYGQLNIATMFDGFSATNGQPLVIIGANYSDAGNDRITASHNFIENGSTLDRQRKPNGFSRLTASAATGSPTLAKSSAGDLTRFWGKNGATATFLQLYNKGSAAPIIGTDTPVLTFPIDASERFGQGVENGGAYFPNGIGFAFTTDAAGTTAAAANAVTAFALLFA